MDDDDGEGGSFKRSGAVPFNWEILPGIPKTQDPKPDDNVPSLLLQPPKKLHPLRLQQLSPPSSPKQQRTASPFAPPPPYIKAKPPSGPPSPYWKSTSSPRGKLGALPRWRLLKTLIGMKKSKRKNGDDSTTSSESDDFSPWEGSSRGSSVATSWSSPLSSSSSSSDLSSSERKVVLMMARAHLG